MLASDAFVYWTDGDTPVPSRPSVCKENVLPFVVRISNRGWIAVNVIVFAESTEHAIHRVMTALRECLNKDYDSARRRTSVILREAESENMVVTCEPYDTSVMSSVAWAANDTVT